MEMRTTITMPVEALALIIDKARGSQFAAADLDDEIEGMEEQGGEEELAPKSDFADAGELKETEDDENGEIDEEDLEAILSDLSDDELAELAALAWIGNGDFSQANWHEALTAARAKAEGDLISDLMATAALGDLIERGLVSLGCRETAGDNPA
jgi:hypothetical protein